MVAAWLLLGCCVVAAGAGAGAGAGVRGAALLLRFGAVFFL